MPRPGDLINEGIENKLALTDKLKSFQFCDKGALIYRMNSVNNERTVVVPPVEKAESTDSGMSSADMEISDDESSEHAISCRARRMALADIFENVNDNDMVNLLSIYVKKEIAQLVNEKRLLRRGAKSDIFEGLSEEDVSSIAKHSCCQDDESCSKEQTESQTPGEAPASVKRRRGGKCDIFEGLTVEQQKDIVNRFYKEYIERVNGCDIKMDTVSPTPDTCFSQSRRGGKFYIFEGLSDEERLHVINMCIETCCKDMEQIQVAYGR